MDTAWGRCLTVCNLPAGSVLLASVQGDVTRGAEIEHLLVLHPLA